MPICISRVEFPQPNEQLRSPIPMLKEWLDLPILVLNNQPSSKQSTEIFVLPTLKEKHAFSNVMDKIKEHLENN